MGEEYEALCAAIAMLDAASQILEDAETCNGQIDEIHEMRNKMNKKRVALLGNGKERPYSVADLGLT